MDKTNRQVVVRKYEKQMDGWMDGQKKQMDGWMDEYIKLDGYKNGRLDGQQQKIDETIDGWKDRKDKCMVGCIV